MSTRLAGGPRALLAGSVALAASPSYPAFGRTPTPGYVLATETPLPSTKRQFTIAGLPAAEVVTVFMVLNKSTLAEDLRMAFSIISQDSYTRTWVGYTGRSYSDFLGVTYNTYVDGFVHIADNQVLDGERTVLLTAKMGRNGVSFYLDGTLQEAVSLRNAQQRLPWSDQVVVGGETGSTYDWQGLISACYVYLGDLTDADRTRTEGYLRAKYPAIS
jgi:hypothetical protein